MDEILIIFTSPLSSVEENALLVKQLLFTINGFILSGSSTTLEMYEPPVYPAKYAPKYFESGDDDNITVDAFSVSIIFDNKVEYTLHVNS